MEALKIYSRRNRGDPTQLVKRKGEVHTGLVANFPFPGLIPKSILAPAAGPMHAGYFKGKGRVKERYRYSEYVAGDNIASGGWTRGVEEEGKRDSPEEIKSRADRDIN
ncbi:hypothetical protein EVAR_51275_1 [Eumeta japonica]|uniref:Uncharacterized protein n=1 Tax=Eumeta variegata TaxID=151549 RepID=A0A4C1Y7W4_EUMVA|nr:hypothetical protein EVAR_51275_1 [Eumeta japonica]